MSVDKVNIQRKFPAANREINALSDHVRDHALEVGIDIQLIELVKVRTSQLNRCAACLSTHVAIAERKGESSQRLATLVAWRGNDLFTPRERAALELTEWTTRIADPISDELYAQIRLELTDDQIAALIWVVIVMNSFNRISITMGQQPAPPRS